MYNMKYVQPTVKLLNVTVNCDEMIELAGRICYKSKPSKTRKGTEKFVKARVREGHISLGRHASAMFEVTCSRACANQIVRSVHVMLHQESQRYVNMNDSRHILPFSVALNEEACDIYNESVEKAMTSYNDLVKIGIPQEDARGVLPINAETKLVLTSNFQGWYDFLELRLDKHAQREIRDIANVIKDCLVNTSCFFYEYDVNYYKDKEISLQCEKCDKHQEGNAYFIRDITISNFENGKQYHDLSKLLRKTKVTCSEGHDVQIIFERKDV